MRAIRVGLLGIGTVGGGTFRVLRRNREEITRRAGCDITMKMVADKDLARARSLAGDGVVVTSDAGEVVSHPDIDIVVELIGGYDSAKRLILEAIAKGKQVVTANKALLAVHGEELYQAAARQKVDLAFEASVGGGIPIIRALTEGLAANRILSIYGIINGTSNYILTRMTQEGRAFEEVLEEAKRAGRVLTNLKARAAAGRLKLYYLDECGFAPTLPTGSSWSLPGQRKLVEYEAPRGRRVNALAAYRPSVPPGWTCSRPSGRGRRTTCWGTSRSSRWARTSVARGPFRA